MPLLLFFLGPIGRWIAVGLAVLVVAGGLYAKVHHDGVLSERARIEQENTRVRDKADDARLRSERDSDAGRVRDDDGFRRD